MLPKTWPALLGLCLAACTTNNTTINGDATVSSSTTATASGTSSTASSAAATGSGGTGGASVTSSAASGPGGAGGAGGGACVPKTCADVPRSCGDLPTGCDTDGGIETVKCQDSCGASAMSPQYCDTASHQCVCTDSSSAPDFQNKCSTDQGAASFCANHSCKAERCDDDPTNKNLPPNCHYLGNWDVVVGDSPGPVPTGFFCCY